MRWSFSLSHLHLLRFKLRLISAVSAIAKPVLVFALLAFVVASCGARTKLGSRVVEGEGGTDDEEDAAKNNKEGGACATSQPPRAPSCSIGTPTLECFSHEQLITLWIARGAINKNADAASAPFDDCGCLPGPDTFDNCCIPASHGPYFTGTTCCYYFCTGSCC